MLRDRKKSAYSRVNVFVHLMQSLAELILIKSKAAKLISTLIHYMDRDERLFIFPRGFLN